MRFRVKDMDIETGGILIAILNEEDAEKLDLKPQDRIKIRLGRKEAVAVLDISESKKAVPPGKIGLFEEVLDKLGAKGSDSVDVLLTVKPESVSHIRSKLHGKDLGYKEIYHIIDDIVNDRLTDIEKTYFVAASYAVGLSMNEIAGLTKAIVETGDRLTFRGEVYDKHSIGGVPGNRTTMIIVPIVAAAGLLMPKTSSRAITSPAGTADTMEVLADVNLSVSKIRKVVKKANACIAWGGAVNLAPADDKIIDVEQPLALDVEGQMLASVMAKKASVGATRVLVDIPLGKTTKAKTKHRADHLKQMFELLGRKLGMKVKVIVTDGSHPIGRGIGPLLEARDVMWVLENDKRGPKDLREKGLRMAGMILELGGLKKGYDKAKKILESGAALKKMNEIIDLQGRRKWPKLGEFIYNVRAVKNGKVREINNLAIARIARMAGAPSDKGAGIYLCRKVGALVKKGDLLFTIYAESKYKLKYALGLMKELDVYRIR